MFSLRDDTFTSDRQIKGGSNRMPGSRRELSDTFVVNGISSNQRPGTAPQQINGIMTQHSSQPIQSKRPMSPFTKVIKTQLGHKRKGHMRGTGSGHPLIPSEQLVPRQRIASGSVQPHHQLQMAQVTGIRLGTQSTMPSQGGTRPQIKSLGQGSLVQQNAPRKVSAGFNNTGMLFANFTTPQQFL
jgi:hypothetical protein